MGDWQRALGRPVEQKMINLAKINDKKVSHLQNCCSQAVKAGRNWVYTSNGKTQRSQTFQNKLKCYLLRDIWKDNAKRDKERKFSILFVKYLTLAFRCREISGIGREPGKPLPFILFFLFLPFRKNGEKEEKAEFKGKNSLKFDSHSCDSLSEYGQAYNLRSLKPPSYHSKMKTLSLILSLIVSRNEIDT